MGSSNRMRRSPRVMIAALVAVAVLGVVHSFVPTMNRPARMTFSSSLEVAYIHEADFFEMMVGGERYEMVPLPDVLMDTTVFVGNLCEFVNDDQLSDLFQSVSSLRTVPASVARKANMHSLQYGFVTFPNAEETQAAIDRFHGYELNGRKIKVEPIVDKPNCNRVKVPEQHVSYTCGVVKRTRDGKVNNMRRSSNSPPSKRERKQNEAREKKAKKQRGGAIARLTRDEFQELERAARKGYLTLIGMPFLRGWDRNNLVNVHRELCDSIEKPQVIHIKGSNGRPTDTVHVDLSTLRIHAAFPTQADEFLTRWKTEILLAACGNNMEWHGDNDHEPDEIDGEPVAASECPRAQNQYTLSLDSQSATPQHISTLPVVSMGAFVGQRADAKSMAKELAKLWDVPKPLPKALVQENKRLDADRRKGNKSRRRSKTCGGSNSGSQRNHRRSKRNRKRVIVEEFFF